MFHCYTRPEPTLVQCTSRWMCTYVNVNAALHLTSLGGTVAGRQTRDRMVAGKATGRGAITSTRSTQPSIPPG